MKTRLILLALAPVSLLMWSSAAWCQDSESALGNPLPPAVQDPSLKTSRYFPPSLGTSGVAYIDPALSAPAKAVKGHGADCSALNPCATPPPARDRVVISAGKG
jgi:hypothetical protein